ncbi:MAG TPA: hypothetical protein VNH65_02470 [Candidatus Acidoferrum sp.]|nr:hypothetical protein [Candidatus Acidoferrum sp.]
MALLAALWLPILLSAVIVFIASSIMHTVLPYHNSDYRKLPEEDAVLAALRSAGVTRGLYHFPHCNHKDMKTPAMQEKFKQGPVGFVTIFPSGPVSMPKFLVQWFIYCLLISFVVAYLAAHTVAPGAPFRHVLRAVGTAAFLGYGLGTFINAIWKGQTWSMTLKEVFDGAVYAILTAGTFAWFWPH